MIGNFGGGGREKCGVQVAGHVMDIGYGSVGEQKMRSDWGRERVRQEVKQVGWMMKSSQRYVGWEQCKEL